MDDEKAVLKLKRRILALIRKSESTEHEAERDSFAAKARQIMEEHQLTMRDVNRADDPLGRTALFCPYSDGVYPTVAAAGARYLGCATLQQRDFDPVRARMGLKMIFLGRESARVTTEIMVPFWWSECVARGRRLHREEGLGRNPRDAAHQIMTAFALRLHEMSPPEDFAEAQGEIPDDTRKGRKRRLYMPSARAREEADTVPVAPQVGGR